MFSSFGVGFIDLIPLFSSKVDTKKLMRGRSNTQGSDSENLDKRY